MFFRHYVYAKIKLRKGILKTLHKLKTKKSQCNCSLCIFLFIISNEFYVFVTKSGKL